MSADSPKLFMVVLGKRKRHVASVLAMNPDQAVTRAVARFENPQNVEVQEVNEAEDGLAVMVIPDPPLHFFPMTEHLITTHPILAHALPPWEGAMVSCFQWEMMVRLAAGKFWPGLSVATSIGDSKGKNGQPGKPGLLTMLYGKLPFTDDEKLFLNQSQKVRNKLIHCQPDALLKEIQVIWAKFKPPEKSQMIRLPNDGSAIREVLETQRGAVPVQSTVSEQDGFVGWMLEAASTKIFEQANAIFRDAVEIIEKKIRAYDGQGSQP
jgi:hypothetical protein